MRYQAIAAVLLAGLFCAGCAAASADSAPSAAPSQQTAKADDTWMPLSDFSESVGDALAQIDAVGVKSVNYTVDNSICVDITDPAVIAELVEAVQDVEVGPSTKMRKTDSGRRMLFLLKDGAEVRIGFASDDYIEVGTDACMIRGFGALKELERSFY